MKKLYSFFLDKWKNKLKSLVGEENLFEVTIPRKTFENFIDDNVKEPVLLLNYLKSYRLEHHLNQQLKNKDADIKKRKL